LHWDRSSFASVLLLIVLGTFGAWYYLERGRVTQHVMAVVAMQSFCWIVAVHGMLIMGGATVGALCIAAEKDRRTLDFVLATPLGNAEIIVGKLAACLGLFFMWVAAGVPITLLLHLLGGIDPWLILLAYAGIATTVFFVVALAIWVSTGAPSARRAGSVLTLCVMAWLVIPFMVSMIVPRFRLPLPEFFFTVNAWVLASSPMSLLPKFAMGAVGVSSALVHTIVEMGELQVAAGLILLVGAIIRLRSAYRVNLGGDGHALGAARQRPFWRFRARPAVSDDPILWREMHTARSGIVMQLLGLLIALAVYAALAYPTYFFARRAFVELWRNGYNSGVITAEKPEFNLMIRFFFTERGGAIDLARTDLNLFLRSVTGPIVFLLALLTAGIAAEGIASERTHETWKSLIATPLSARDILRSKVLASLWRLRGLLATLLGLWTIGLLAGAIHPLGFFLTLVELAAWTWLLLLLGQLAALHSKDQAATTNRSLSLMLLPIFSGILPFVLPARVNSVVLGAGSSPFVTWLSLFSYRDARAALQYSAYPQIAWAGIATGEGWAAVAAACVLGIVLPAAGGLWCRRYLIAHFDRLIGRPWHVIPLRARLSRNGRAAGRVEL
jgi:ABC-type transport system involved in multi-copper enzyme maturation permease subunit